MSKNFCIVYILCYLSHCSDPAKNAAYFTSLVDFFCRTFYLLKIKLYINYFCTEYKQRLRAACNGVYVSETYLGIFMVPGKGKIGLDGNRFVGTNKI